jgi:predicted DNA-binding WGR domain protein
MSASKWVLLSISDGGRGEQGKQKVYEITVDPSGKVTFEWGMAEKPSRQTKVQSFWSEGAARQVALNQVNAKLAKGYRLAYAV